MSPGTRVVAFPACDRPPRAGEQRKASASICKPPLILARASNWRAIALDHVWKQWLCDASLRAGIANTFGEYRLQVGAPGALRHVRVLFHGPLAALYRCLIEHQGYRDTRLRELPFRALHACPDCEAVVQDCLIAEAVR